ncbi:MAG: glycosyl transferase [Candidatus Velthaea sp.]
MASKRYPVLDHLVAMTDDVGMVQHATHDIPNRSTGYCTDDIARGLIVAVEAAGREATEAVATRLVSVYLSYLHDAQMTDGWFHNFMGYDRTWQDTRGTPDSFGRALWGLGVCMRSAPRDSWRRVATNLVTNALPHVEQLEHRRSRAYAVLGLVNAMEAQPGEGAFRDAVADATGTLERDFHRHARPDWRWCEELMTYDNGRLCEALIRGGAALGDPQKMRTGLEMLDFYASVVIEDGMFSPVGNDGWLRRGGVKARFGQQPLEAAAMVDAGLAAYQHTGDERYRRYAEIAYDWFFGRNTHRALLVTNGGCRDGIDPTGVNPNMGAESTIAYLLSAVALAQQPAQRLSEAR